MNKTFLPFIMGQLRPVAISLLTALMLVGGSSFAWGVYNGTSLATGWETPSNIASSSNKIKMGSSTNSFTYSFTETTGQLNYQNTYGWHVVRSTGTVKVLSRQKIVIMAKGQTSTAECAVNYSLTSKTENSSFTSNSYTTEVRTGNPQSNPVKLVYDVPEGDLYIQIVAKGVYITSIEIVDPVLSVTSDAGGAFGAVTADVYKDYTIKNNSKSTVSVVPNITGDSSFTVSDKSGVNIASGSTHTFRVSFDYDSNDPGSKAAYVNFTPDGDSDEILTINLTATAAIADSPELSVTPGVSGPENAAFGTKTVDGIYSKTYTVTNSGTGTMDVTIESDNTEYFSVDPESIENLGAGESGDFTVTFTWYADAAKLGVKSATITVTPDYDEGAFATFSATATASTVLTLDEMVAPVSLTTGSKASVLVKYSPQTGWNTICVPFVLKDNTIDYMTPIFGSEYKVYTLTGFVDKVLTFTKKGDNDKLYGAVPYLVYAPNASGLPYGILFENLSISHTSPQVQSSYGTGTTATFVGTFPSIAKPDMEGRWGVTTAGKLAQGTDKASIKGYRAYIETSEPAEARLSLAIDEGDAPTLIGAVKMMENTNEVYNLNGQRVENVKRGLYVVNGRKVVIK